MMFMNDDITFSHQGFSGQAVEIFSMKLDVTGLGLVQNLLALQADFN